MSWANATDFVGNSECLDLLFFCFLAKVLACIPQPMWL